MKAALRKSLCSVIVLGIFLLPVKASEVKYKVSDIPAELLTDAKAVIRNSETLIEISDINKVVKKVTYAITILNENGIENSVMTQYYDKFSSVRKLKAELYDRNGVAIKNGTNVEVEDYSANVGYNLYEDNRVKFLDPKYRTTPFTVEYTYEISYDGIFFCPNWTVYDDYNISVEKSSFTIFTSSAFNLRYLEKNIINRCSVSAEGGKTKYLWKYENMPAIRKEPYSVPYFEYTPIVYSSPGDFEISGYKGNLDSWKNFGKWINLIGNGRNILPDETIVKIKNLVSGITDDTEKIRVLYNYFQNKVRYVNIKIGIGGWQTIEARQVDHVSYGDCKALSNYMKSLLDVIGIRSYYTLVRAGGNAPVINEDFPSNQFNHIILCIPQNRDTLWLECTSQNIPFGYLGTFTDDRKALITGEDGGVLVRTKKYTMEDNSQFRSAIVDLAPDGNANSTVLTDYSGVLYDKIFPVLHMDEVDGRKFVQAHISIPSYNLISFSHKETKNIIPGINEDLNLKISACGIVMGNRILFKPNLMTRVTDMPFRTKDRKSEICVRRPVNEIDTILFRLPVNYKLDRIPPKISVVSKFGEYTAEILTGNNSIRYVRSFRLFNGNYPVTDYSDFVDFFEKIALSDESKIALIR